MESLYTAVSLLLLPFLYSVYTLSFPKAGSNLPPGPPTSWFGLYVEGLPNCYQWLTYSKWRSIYGDLIYIRAFGNPLLIINSAAVANDLLEKRGANYSSRPYRIMVNDLMGFDWLFSTMPYGNSWKKHRQRFTQHFHQNNIPSFHRIITRETSTMLHNLVQSPEKFSKHVRRYTTGVAMDVAYGHKVSEDEDFYVTLADKALTGLGLAGIFGTYLIDYIPVLKYVPEWMPGAKFKRDGREWKEASLRMVDCPFQMVEHKLMSGECVPCFAAVAMESWLSSERKPEDRKVIKETAAAIYAGGADTTAAALLVFFLVMAMNPERQQKAQEEIDSVLNHGRLPTLDDKEALPSVMNIVWECLRWNPVTPLGLAHFTAEDNVYNGYLIPKGTTVFPNIWEMFHDATIYPDPMTFNPDRFLDKDRNRELDINPEPTQAFGFSRRVCPGKLLAIDMLWLNIAAVLSVFEISEHVDVNGSVVKLQPEFTSSSLCRPKPFKCSVTPRSAELLALIN